MEGKCLEQNSSPIDIVITWVDGSDPQFISKKNSYCKQEKRYAIPGAHHTRFASSNEIKYCVLSILRFAPFVRNVFIVTDGQNPNIEEAVAKYFPSRASSIRIVDHKEIFRGYEKYLPTFNSRTIESMIWRIPGLSENFVYFNDDLFLVRPIKPTDWFVNNKPVLRGKWVSAPILRSLWNSIRIFVKRHMLVAKHYEVRPSFHLGQWNSAKLAGYRTKYFANSHTPHAVSVKPVGEFLNNNNNLLENNIRFKFRNYQQFNFVSLSNHLQLKLGNLNIAKPDLVYLKPHNRKNGYIENKLQLCQNSSEYKFLCIQSLELCSKSNQQKLFAWMDKLLELETTTR